MRLLILHLATVFGGAERTTANLLTHLDREVITHIRLACPGILREQLPNCADSFVDTSARIARGWFTNSSDLLADARTAGALIGDAAPDLVLGMMHYPAALAALGVRLARSSVKSVGSFRGPVYEHMRHYERGLRRRSFMRLAVGATARLADRMIVPSQGTARELRRHFLGPARRTVVIPNGIDCSAVDALAAEPATGLERLDRDLPLICVAARLSPEKDLGLLLTAFRLARESLPMALALVGDGPERANLERLVADWGLGHCVALLGHRENVFPYIRRADVYVHTCQFEGFGYTMLEAMACRTPVIATDCPYGPREVIGNNQFGVLVPCRDPGALAAAIVALLTDPPRRRHLAELGRTRAEALSIGRMVRRYEEVFRGLVSPRAGSGQRVDGVR